MAHNIVLDKRTGKHSFAAKGEKAWHGLGQYVDEAMNAAQVIELAQLDYTVEKRPIHIYGADGIAIEIDNKVATVRTDTDDVLGIVSPTYEILQNIECFNFFDPLIDRQEAIYETAGALGKGERIFMTAKLPEDIVVNGETIEQYVLLTNGHDGLNTLTACFTPIRVVCNNTLTAALRGGNNKIKLYHQKNIQEKLSEAHKVMGMASTYVQLVTPIYEKMALTKITDEKLKKFILEVMNPNPEVMSKEEAKEISTRLQNTVDKVYDFANTHETQMTDAAKGTVWGAFNSISGYLNYVKEYKNADVKMKDITFGLGSKQIQKAFDLAMELS